MTGPPVHASLPRARARALVLDCGLAVALTLVGLAVRAPHFNAIPRYTDEVREVAPALSIAFEGARPLVHNEAYRGAHWVYLVAGAMRTVGLGPELPRLVALLLGSLTVGATYLLARAVTGRTAGVVAALLMSTAFSHVVLNSHVAWANNSTPLWITLAAALLAVGAAHGGIALVLSGAAWGMALTTHPSALFPLLGAMAWFVTDRSARRRLLTPALWASAGVFLLVMSPMVHHNLMHDLQGVADATQPVQPLERDPGARSYLANIGGLLGQLGRMAGAGPVLEAGDPVPDTLVAVTDRLRSPASAAYALALLGAVGVAAWRGPRLPAFMAVAGVLLLPLVNRSYLNFYDTRYLAFLLPLSYVAVGALAGPALATTGRARATAAVATAALAVYPLLALAAHYDRELAAGRTNAPLNAAADLLAREARGPGHYVLVDKAMRPIKMGGGGDPTGAFEQLLQLHRVSHELSDTEEIRWFLLADPSTDFWIVAADATAADLADEFQLTVARRSDGWLVAERQGSSTTPP